MLVESVRVSRRRRRKRVENDSIGVEVDESVCRRLSVRAWDGPRSYCGVLYVTSMELDSPIRCQGRDGDGKVGRNRFGAKW